jgi:hypothetical protein
MVLDHNILNRATFDDRQIQHEISLVPHIYEGGNTLEFGPNVVFWIKSITWRFTYRDVGFVNTLRTPLQNVEVSVGNPGSLGGIGNIINNVREPRPEFQQPIPILERLNFKVKNTNLANNMQLVVKFKLDGTLVTPKPGATPISYKEALGYIMLSADKKGELILAEATMDAVEEHMKQKGMPGIREKLPQGLGFGAISMLTPQLKSLMMGISAENAPFSLENGATATTQLKQLALNEDPKKAFIGDLVAGCTNSYQITKEDLQQIAEYMIQQGWRKLF